MTNSTVTPTSEPEVEPTRHGPIAQLLIALSPLSLILIGYALTHWITAPLLDDPTHATNRIGIGLQVSGPADVDRSFFAAVPTVWLQEHFATGEPHWYDAVASVIYVTHFMGIPLVTALAWFRIRARFTRWIGAVLAFSTLGMAGYVLYPAAPPWWASDRGEIGPVVRTSTSGWDYLHLRPIGQLLEGLQDGSNPVAAMPSLHAGAALLVALFLAPHVGRRGRVLLGTYVVGMAVTLVFTAEHYVIDVLVGWLVAVVAIAVSRKLRPSSTTAPVPSPAPNALVLRIPSSGGSR